MKRIVLACLAALCSAAMASSQKTEPNYQSKQPYKSWVNMAPKLEDDFFKTDEARRIGDNVLLYQQTTGGWPKNIYMPAALDEKELEEVLSEKDDVNQSTIDNKATTTEIAYLARLYNATHDEKYKKAIVDGINYLFKAQYDNGGWPQFYPRPKGYYTHITYNDDAMINVMKLLRDVAKGKAPFSFLPQDIRQQAETALYKGVDCILKTQVKQNGKLTVWCAQHDEHTLEPAKARAYELPSLSGAESDNIVLFLMTLPNPSPEVINCIEAAVAWFKESQINGLKRETYTNADGKKDFRMVPCPQGEECKPLWARFYTLEDNRPFFCDRDGIKRFDISEIGYERRNGYSWYNDDGLKVFKKYEQWKKKLKKAAR